MLAGKICNDLKDNFLNVLPCNDQTDQISEAIFSPSDTNK
jgi:hypothetical protein